MGLEKKTKEEWRGKRLEGWHRKEANFLNWPRNRTPIKPRSAFFLLNPPSHTPVDPLARALHHKHHSTSPPSSSPLPPQHHTSSPIYHQTTHHCCHLTNDIIVPPTFNALRWATSYHHSLERIRFIKSRVDYRGFLRGEEGWG